MAVDETAEARRERYKAFAEQADDTILRYQLSLARNSIELDFLCEAPEPLVMYRDAIEAELYRRKELT